MFLSRTRTLAPAPLLPDIEWAAFGVRQDLIGGEALASYRSLYLRHSRPRLHLNTFRGVRAISKFDWPFTPTHRSSESFSTLTGSDLQTESPVLHPAHGSITWFRVHLRRLTAPSSDSLSLRLRAYSPLTSPATVTRRFIMQKARGHHTEWLPPLVGARFQGLFHSSARGSFHLSLTVLVRYRSLGSI